jgi:serine/threonine protein kinase
VKNLENSVKTSKNGFRSPKDFKNKSLRAIIGEDTLLVDLISSNPYSECLTWDPAERLSSEEALCHPWLKKTIKNISSLPNLNEKFDSLKSPKNLKNPEKPEKKLFPETPKKGLKRSFFH